MNLPATDALPEMCAHTFFLVSWKTRLKLSGLTRACALPTIGHTSCLFEMSAAETGQDLRSHSCNFTAPVLYLTHIPVYTSRAGTPVEIARAKKYVRKQVYCKDALLCATTCPRSKCFQEAGACLQVQCCRIFRCTSHSQTRSRMSILHI